MADQEPIKIREVCKLTSLGINQQFINFNFVSLESEKFVSVKEQQQQGNKFHIVDLTAVKCDSNNMKADAAINHPTAKVVGLRAGKKLQVRNLEMQSAVAEHTMTDDVVFWKWISPSVLALVTADAVYHWSMQGGAAPRKVFDRLPDLASSQIIAYRGDEQEKWFCLAGLAREGDAMRGHLQLYSAEKNASQHIEGHTACFVSYKMPGTEYTANLVCIAVAKPEGGTLFIRDLNMDSNLFEKKTIPITFQAGDFPVAMQGSSRFGIVYLLTRTGTLTLYDVHSGTLLFGKRLADPIFITAPTSKDGFIGVNRSGSVVGVHVDEDAFVPFLMNKLGNMELAFAFASRAGLPGAEDLYQRKFDQILASGNFEQAIRLVSISPRGFLRNQNTIERFKAMPAGPDGKPPVLAYFRRLLETDKLNAQESFELALMALQRPNGAGYLKNLFDEGKIEGSERLGDLVRQYDRELALKLYARGNAGGKVVEALIEGRQFENVFKYVESTDTKPDWISILQNLLRPDRLDPEGAEKLATMLAQRQLVDPNRVADLFVQVGLFQQVTSFLIDVLKEDKPEQSALQTRLLEITLASCPPHITEGIFANNLISHYDKNKIAQLCERKQLFARALENYEDIEDIKRVIIHATHLLDPAWLIQFFGNLDVDDCLVCFQELLKRNLRQNLQLVVAAAKQYSTQIGTDKLINLFDTFKSPEGMFHFLRGIVPISEDPEVHFRYIEAAVKVGQLAEVERMTHDSDKYDPVRTKEFLKEARLTNMWPLINVCDKYNYIQELVEYLYNNSQLKYVDAYVQQRSPQNTPKVIGALLDVDCNEDHIVKLLEAVGPLCPIEPLCDEVEKRGRLKLCLPWLEARFNEGVQETALHNALAKVYLDTNKDAQRFLETNPYYDSLVVGEYCEKRDPLLAYIAYRRGKCDEQLVRLTNKNSMYRQQAKYLVERQDADLWATVLNAENSHRQNVIDQVIQSALPESRDTEEVSSTVKAFMSAHLPNQLIELLEKIVLHGNSEFRSNRNLQNLLILTAVNSDQSRVMGYVQQLDNYDGVEVAKITFNAELFEECFFVYKKNNMRKEAISVLLNNIRDMVRSQEYADKVNDPEVYSLLGRAQLENNMVKEAIASYMKADDPNDFMIVIEGVNRVQDFYADLIKYLTMARKKIKDNNIDTEMVYSFARINKLAELEDFIAATNIAKLQQVGDRCFDEGMYQAAKILFTHTGNNAKLASTFVKLGDFPQAYDAAKKASNIRTWKEVALACIDAGQFQLAHMSALNIVVSVDHMDAIINHYETKGLFDEVIHLLEVGLSMEKAHPGMFTELGILYAKYKPEKLMEHIRLFHKKVNTSKLLRACETHHHWKELRYLYSLIDEHDNAVRTMIDHSVEAWEHSVFKEEIVQVRNLELYYRSVSFYLDEKPDLLVDLMSSLSSRIDHARVVNEVRRVGHLPLIKPYMQSVQPEDLKVVNEALNSLYVEEEDYEKLRVSIDNYGNFDQIALAQQCEKHILLEFRRIAAYIYKKNERYEQSIELSKKDRLYQDAMETAAASGKEELAEQLLIFFVEIGQRECFAACLFTCYPLIKPDVALELGWRNNILDFAMPFLIQFVREYADKVDGIIRERAVEKEVAKAEKEEAEASIDAPAPAMPVVVDPIVVQMTGGIMPAPGMYPAAGLLPFMNTGAYY